jgi:CRISPR/Cas system CMR subunit Cmr4 (Cas7 group RAMP superfamily)
MKAILKIELLSDATFGRGDGVAGVVDSEVEHDPKTGLPFIRATVLNGLFAEECANILYSLKRQCSAEYDAYRCAARYLFGKPGSDVDTAGHLAFGSAVLPESLRDAVTHAVFSKHLTPQDALESLTTIRRQTAVDDNGVPEEGSLRSMRVVLRETTFTSELSMEPVPADADLRNRVMELLAACATAVKRGGTGRNRGRGRLNCTLVINGTKGDVWLDAFAKRIGAPDKEEKAS